MKKKITLITSFFENPFYSNRAPYNGQLFQELKQSFDIQIISPIAWTNIFTSSVKKRKQEYYRSQWNEIPVFYPTYYFIPRIALSTNGNMYYHSIKKVFKQAQNIPDIFYTTWAYPDAYATMLLARKYGKKYILRVHGSDINDLAYRKKIRGKIQLVLKNAAVIISPSSDLKEKIVQLGVPPDKINVIYSGVDSKKFYYRERKNCERQLSLVQGKKRVLYIGNLKKAKGVLDLLEAANLMKKELDNFEILFIGKGESRHLMDRFIKNHRMHDIIRIIGPVDHHQLNPWINSCDCLCLPSYSEGLPNVLLEALACKTNIVATRVGGIPEIIKNAEQYLVEPGDPEALKNKLVQVLKGQLVPVEAAISIRSYGQIAQDIEKIINNLLEF